MNIQKVQPQDAQQLLSLAIETFTDTYASANTAENMQQYLDENFTLTRMAEELKDPHALIFFAMLDHVPAGYIKLNLEKSILDGVEKNGMEIERIYVRKQYKGKQIGRLLFDTAVEMAREHRQKYIWLGVWEKNPDAISFYGKMGFQPAGSHLFKLGEDMQRDILMRIEL